jgi:hypothetical protein
MSWSNTDQVVLRPTAPSFDKGQEEDVFLIHIGGLAIAMKGEKYVTTIVALTQHQLAMEPATRTSEGQFKAGDLALARDTEVDDQDGRKLNERRREPRLIY